ncbi:MAG: hypothetical protein HYV09_24685 [Deltaproteobacteria bacterium]|nr:hypothetical protein [Deltaproteobacteria bacterium]
MARPTKLTDDVQAKVCEAIRAGSHYEAAARHAGVGRTTFFHWLELGKSGKGARYVAFAEAVERAENDMELALVAFWRRAAMKDWKAARGLLERRFRDRWGKEEKIQVQADVKHSGGVQVYLPAEEDGSAKAEPSTTHASETSDSASHS